MAKTKFDNIINDMVNGAESNYELGIKNDLKNSLQSATSLNATTSSDETNTEEEIERNKE